MKNLTLLALTATTLAVSFVTTSHAATPVFNAGGSPPTLPSDQSVGAFFNYNGSDYDASDGFTGGSSPGQTFLTPTSAAAFSLDSIFLQESGGSGSLTQSGSYTLGIFSVVGNTLVSLGTEDFVFSGGFPGAGGYFGLDTSALGLVLTGGTEYAFTFNNGPGATGYFGIASSPYGTNLSTTAQNTYADGVAISFNAPAPVGTVETINMPTVGGASYDRAFEVGLTAVTVPEPSTYAMMIGGVVLLIVIQRRRFQV